MRSQVTFEEISALQKLKKTNLIVTFYHWCSPDTDNYRYPLRLKDLKEDRGLFVCDDAFSWATPHLLDTSQLYEVDCVIRNPLCLMEQFLEYEQIFRDPSPEYSLFLEGGFDALIVTPHQYSRGIRQCLIRNPKKQVLAIREVSKPTADEVRQVQEKQATLWGQILFPNKRKRSR